MRRIYKTGESILEGIRSADDNALEHLYKVHYDMIRSLVLKNSGNEDDVQDIWQEGIIAFYEKAKDRRFELTCEVNTYLYSICRNKWLKVLRERKLEVQLHDVHHKTILLEESDGEAALTRQQNILTELINTVGETCKQILSFFYYENLSMVQIAERMGYTNAENAKNQKYKCLKRLQKMVLERYNELSVE